MYKMVYSHTALAYVFLPYRVQKRDVVKIFLFIVEN